MPILVGRAPTVPPPPLPSPGATPRPWPFPPRPPRVRERIEVTLTAPDGSVWPLTVPRAAVRALATSAFGAAGPVAHTLDDNPRGGVSVRDTWDEPRYLILPILVRGTSHMDFAERWRAIGDAITQTVELGPGTLRITRPDGTWRETSIIYSSGWEGGAGQGWDWDIASALTLLAPRPWWFGPATEPIEREFGALVPFLHPYPRASSSRVLGDTEIYNPGQVRAWLDWEVEGPLTSLTATNHSVGDTFVFTPARAGGVLATGSRATIATDPVRVRGPAGEIWTGTVTGSLWPLRRGANRVTFAAAGAAAGAKIRLSYRPRYRMG